MINPKIAQYATDKNLHFMGTLNAKVSLIIDAFPKMVHEIFHDQMIEQLRAETLNNFKNGVLNNCYSINTNLHRDILQILNQDFIPEELYDLWVDHKLMIVPLSCNIYMRNREDWNQEIDKNFRKSMSFALASRTYVLTKNLSEEIKQEAKKNHSQIIFI